MKKILLLILTFCAYIGFSQFQIELTGVYSVAQKSIFQSAKVTLPNGERTDYNSVLFEAAVPSFGAGFQLKYVENRWAVGIASQFIKYFDEYESEGAKFYAIMTHGFADYFLLSNKFKPYVGSEWGLVQTKIEIDAEKVLTQDFSKTNFGLGFRAGLVYEIMERWNLRLGTRYVISKNFPTINVELGLAYDIGAY